MNTRKRLLGVAVLTAAPLLSALPAQAMLPGTVECIRAPCPVMPVTVETTAAHVFGPNGYKAHGWTCSHIKGRHWECVEPTRTHRRP
ncbi:MAG TPA: hypothetical protein VFH54_02470 [Mycobacteriales bacterium]|nr:hypothetical protein [Mycobacteriales bacterium]